MNRLGLVFLVSLTCLTSQAIAKNPYPPEESEVIKSACIELGRKFAEFVNLGEFTKVAALFEENGEYIKSGGKLSGRESIELAFTRLDNKRNRAHILTNERAEILSKNLVVVTSYITHYQGADEPPKGLEPVPRPHSIVKNYDECVRTEEGEWLWQTREVKEVFAPPK